MQLVPANQLRTKPQIKGEMALEQSRYFPALLEDLEAQDPARLKLLISSGRLLDHLREQTNLALLLEDDLSRKYPDKTTWEIQEVVFHALMPQLEDPASELEPEEQAVLERQLAAFQHQRERGVKATYQTEPPQVPPQVPPAAGPAAAKQPPEVSAT